MRKVPGERPQSRPIDTTGENKEQDEINAQAAKLQDTPQLANKTKFDPSDMYTHMRFIMSFVRSVMLPFSTLPQELPLKPMTLEALGFRNFGHKLGETGPPAVP